MRCVMVVKLSAKVTGPIDGGLIHSGEIRFGIHAHDWAKPETCQNRTFVLLPE